MEKSFAELDSKIEIIELEVEEKNEKAFEFYKKNGFEIIGRRENDIEGTMLSVIVMQTKI